jgi:hypothetical protein
MQLADEVIALVTGTPPAPVPDPAKASRLARPHAAALADCREELAEAIARCPRQDGEYLDTYRWRLIGQTGDLFARIGAAGRALHEQLNAEREERERRERNERERVQADKEVDARCAELLATIGEESQLTAGQWATAAEVLRIVAAAERARSSLHRGDPAGRAAHWRTKLGMPAYPVPDPPAAPNAARDLVGLARQLVLADDPRAFR